MKKSLFVLTATLMASSAAFAMDVSNPFYVPMKGDFLSETNIAYNNFEHGDSENATLAETLSYGITRDFSVNATIADTWLFDEPGVTGHDRYDNPAWGIGMKYNLVDCCKTNWKVQLGADYKQGGLYPDQVSSILGGIFAAPHHVKFLSAYAKAGYQMGNFLPYATVTGYKPIGQYESNGGFETRLALYTGLTKKTNLDFGVSYDWSSAKYDMDSHPSAWAVDATVNYVFSDCMSTGLTGKYLMRTKPSDVDAYSVGVNFKVAF